MTKEEVDRRQITFFAKQIQELCPGWSWEEAMQKAEEVVKEGRAVNEIK